MPTAYSAWGDEERAAINRVMRSGRWTMGEETERFEAELAAYHGRKHAICVNSGSSANLIAVAALFHVKENPLMRLDVAAVPALAWATTYAPLAQHGMDLLLMDCEQKTWNVEEPGVSALSFNAAPLIVGCSILGNPAQLDVMEQAASKAGAWFINDNCESIGAKLNGIPVGKYGDMATLSFFYSHQLSAVEGGAVLTDNDELNTLLRMLRDHGSDRTIKKPTKFEEEYSFHLFGYNLRPVEMHMAIARVQLQRLGIFRTARTKNWYHFAKCVAGLPITLPTLVDTPSPFGIHFTCETQEARSLLVQELRHNSIDARLPTGGSFRLHKYGKPWRDQLTPNADHIHTHSLFIGNAPWDITPKIERAAAIIRETLS